MKFELITLISCLAYLTSATPIPEPEPEAVDIEERATTTLNQAALNAGKKFFGTATNYEQFSNSNYANVMNTQFGSLTPANVQKWSYTEPNEGQYDYSQGDTFVNYAQQHGKILSCDNLVWHQEYPSWIDRKSWTKQQMLDAITAHVTSEVSHYKGKCYSWNVANEVFNDDGTWRNSVFYAHAGQDYVAAAFKAAAAADPGALLYYNDYNIESPGAKANAVQNLITSLKNQGIKIDGVGLESHFIVGQTPSQQQQQQQMQNYVNLGMKVWVTELDVRHTSLPPSSQALQQQATDYQQSIRACRALGSNCPSISVWDFDDQYSWIPSTFSGQGAADLYDNNLNPKPAYQAVINALNGQ